MITLLFILLYLIGGVWFYFDIDKEQINKVSKTKFDAVKTFIMIVSLWSIFFIFAFTVLLMRKMWGKK